MTVDYRLDAGNLFNVRRLQTATKIKSSLILEQRHADDCDFVANTHEALTASELKGE